MPDTRLTSRARATPEAGSARPLRRAEHQTIRATERPPGPPRRKHLVADAAGLRPVWPWTLPRSVTALPG